MMPATNQCKHSDLDTTGTSMSSNDSGVRVSTLSHLSLEALKKQFVNYTIVDGRFIPPTPPETPPEMPQNETPPAQSCSNKNAKGVSGEDTKKSDADASSSYTVSSDISGGETDDSEVDLFDMREAEGDISGEWLVAVYDGPDVQEVNRW